MSLVSPILGYKQYHHSNLISLLAFYRLSKLNLHLALYPQLFLGFQKYMKQKSHVHTCICIFQLKQLSSLCRNPQEFNTDSFVCCVASFVSASFFNICLTLCNPMNHSPSGSTVHGILQARILGWAALFPSRGYSQPRDQTFISYISCIGRQVLTTSAISLEAGTNVILVSILMYPFLILSICIHMISFRHKIGFPNPFPLKTNYQILTYINSH